jgi:hypothetical protein
MATWCVSIVEDPDRPLSAQRNGPGFRGGLGRELVSREVEKPPAQRPGPDMFPLALTQSSSPFHARRIGVMRLTAASLAAHL